VDRFAGERDVGVFGECAPALRQVIGLHGENALLAERHGFVEHRPVIEAEHHAPLDHASAADALEQIAVRNERPLRPR